LYDGAIKKTLVFLKPFPKGAKRTVVANALRFLFFLLGVPGVISRKFSVREIATKSLLVARTDYIWKNNAFCYMLLHTPREM